MTLASLDSFIKCDGCGTSHVFLDPASGCRMCRDHDFVHRLQYASKDVTNAGTVAELIQYVKQQQQFVLNERRVKQ